MIPSEVRPIDANAVLRKLVDNGWLKMNALEDSPEMIAVHSILLDAPTLEPPPNRPLTLEELLEMGGEPVWIAELGINSGNGYYVMFCGFDGHENKAHFDNEYPRLSNDYGKTWLAYRRKPEEGDTA